jgi:uncharacterized integral membrane protein
MGALLLIYLTLFAAVICGSVILIQLGGWLAILSAVLIIIHFFITGALLVILGIASWAEKEKIKKQEAQKHERMGA